MESKLTQKLYIIVHVCIFFIVLSVCIVGGDVHPIPTAASEEPSWLSLHHQSLTHPQLQK